MCSVNDVALEDSCTDKLIQKLIRIISRLKGTSYKGFNIENTIRGEMKIESQIRKNTDPLLMFLEYRTSHLNDSYIYQDLSVDFISRMRETSDKHLSKYTPLAPKTSTADINKRKSMTSEFYLGCRGIFTMSQWLTDDLVQNKGIDENKVHCVGGGCNIDYTRIDTSKKTGNKFLFVGKDFERKNGPLVVEAFKNVYAENNSLELYIIGPAEKPTGTDYPGVKFIGRLGYDELVSYYNLCDYFIMPSLFEAYGIVFAEALIFGLPCIGRNAYAMPEFIDNGANGLLVDGYDVDELASAMNEMYLQRNRYVNNVSAYHEDYVSRYSWDSVAERIVKVMRNDGYKI